MPAAPHYHPRPDRWPQVSLRGFFVLVSLLGIVLGWIALQVKWIRQRHEATKLHDDVQYTWGEPSAPWSIRWLGERGRQMIVLRDDESEDERKRIEGLFPEASVRSYAEQGWTKPGTQRIDFRGDQPAAD